MEEMTKLTTSLSPSKEGLEVLEF